MENEFFWTQLTGKILRAAFEQILSQQRTQDGFGQWQGSVDLSFEVKKLKRVSGRLTGEHHWIEIQQANGDKGWLYNPVSFFAFETPHAWLLVDAAALRDLMEQQTIREWCKAGKPELFKLYNRQDDDLIILVETEWLKKVSFLTIPKGENK